MIIAVLHKILAYCLGTIFLLSGHACAYGAEALAPPTKLNIELPAGFQINVFSHIGEALGGEMLAQPRMMAFDSQGRLYVALANSNSVAMLPDANKDGLAENPVIIVSHLNAPNSIAFIDDNTMLIGNQDGVVTIHQKNGTWSAPTPFISPLPYGHHTFKTVKVGPDHYIYVNIGSSCNVCLEVDPMRATILRYTLDGKPAGSLVTLGRHATNPIWASGLRNSQGFAWRPSGAMFATNNGADNRSSTKNGKVNDNIPPEHLNRIEAGKHYGWPYCWGKPSDSTTPANLHTMVKDPNFLADSVDFCKTSTPPAITFTSHSTPIGITFLDKSNFPAEYKNDAIVALHGSWNRSNPSGYKLVRVKFNGETPAEVLDFATGWLNVHKAGQTQSQAWGRPVDVIAGPDGALYVSDDRAAVIYRISYKK